MWFFSVMALVLAMFLACIMPEARKHGIVAVLIIISFISSYIAFRAPALSHISSGTKTIILTVIIATVAAIAFPHPEVEDDD